LAKDEETEEKGQGRGRVSLVDMVDISFDLQFL